MNIIYSAVDFPFSALKCDKLQSVSMQQCSWGTDQTHNSPPKHLSHFLSYLSFQIFINSTKRGY